MMTWPWVPKESESEREASIRNKCVNKQGKVNEINQTKLEL